MFQTSIVVLAEPPSPSMLRGTPSSHIVSLQVEDFCVTCWINNANLVSDPRRHAGPGTFRGGAGESAANVPDPDQRCWDSQEAEEEDEAAFPASSWILL